MLHTRNRPDRRQTQRPPPPRLAPGPRTRFLLSGLLHCAYCGAPMTGKVSGRNKWTCYLCVTHARDRSACPDSKPLSAAMVEETVIGKFCDHILTAENLTALYEQWQTGEALSAETRQSQTAEVRAQL